MKTILKIKFDNTFYIFLILILLSGMFKEFSFIFILIIFHELGHAITGVLLGFKLDKIIIYPYGGITKFNNLLNTNLNKEILVIVMGPIIQIITYLILNKIFKYNYIKNYHLSILIFNLLPILSLDGGKLLNIILNKFFSYLKSFYISVFISFISIFSLLIYSLIYYKNLNLFLMMIFLLFKIYISIKNIKYNYQRFLLERYLYDFNFKKNKFIKNIYDFSKEYYHYIEGIDEKKYLEKYYKRV